MVASMPVTTEGWEAPVFHAMQVPPTLWGVPQAFFAADALLTLFVGVVLWWPAFLVGAGLYGIAWLGTSLEPYWLGILWAYLGYAQAYEG